MFSMSARAQADGRSASTQVAETVAAKLPDAPVVQTGGVEVAQTAQPPAPASPEQPSSSAQPVAAKPGDSTATPAAGANATAVPDPASAADIKQKNHDQAEQDLKKEEKQRLLGVMPQFQVVMNGQAVPLTGGQKWRLALHSAVDPFYITWAFVIGGGYGELVGNNNGYGWDAQGYLKRVGANYADNVNGALIGNALLPQLLHQDPRYFRKGTGPILRRFLYAAGSTVNFVSGAISNSYYPANERGMALTLENGASVTLFGALGGQILEFGPDLSRLVMRKHKTAPVTPAPAAPVASAQGSDAGAPAK
jgi:hypothetical protein